MKRKIALIYPDVIVGGVLSVKQRLFKALTMDGYEVVEYTWSTRSPFKALSSDLKLSKVLGDVDASIYLGNIALPSYMFVNHPTAIFLHGIIKYELLGNIFHSKSNLWSKIKQVLMLLWHENINKKIKPSIFICPCITTGVENKVKEYGGDLTRAAVELAKDWRTDRILRKLEALLLVADKKKIFLISGTGDVIEPEEGIIAIGSGGNYAYAAARAYMETGSLSAREIAEKSLNIASDICIYTNKEILVEEIK